MNGNVVIRFDRSAFVDRVTENVEDAAEGRGSDRDGDRLSGVEDFHPSHHAFGASQGDGTNATATEVLLNLTGQVDRHAFVLGLDFDGVVNRRHLAFGELDVEGRSDNLRDSAGRCFGCGGHWRW